MRTAALIMTAILAYSVSVSARKNAWEARNTWPVAAQSVVVPEVSKGAGLLLGREMAADLFWVRALVYYGGTRAETGDYDQLEQFIDAILDLDPNFKTVYEWAAYAVTFKEDVSQEKEFHISIRYLERAMKQYPNEAKYFWQAGVRYYLDLWSEDPEQRRKWRERGAELISQSMTKKGATTRMATLASALHTKLGKKDRAIRELQQMIMTTDNPYQRKLLENRLRGIGGQEVFRETMEARRNFDKKHKEELPLTPPSLYVILGDAPEPGFDLDKLGEGELFVLGDDGELRKQ